ncbi:Cytochrome P450 monooxygenase aflN [Colletotrichum orbiculare MAFF 240422]|uniref:Cytochrome P450 monooxygenase aflN n=1 Tax=Colletotrichum orbiculare (strain 104-T / ATCC 96160 / CBS 514.97 / LARS 414 / MAFF 240422) TaxID=1213857 RepID=A0A484FW55_COLOR|nr:Cytochrome P450 monooxygenase aflN [Colletotrichum orbiculare MAFF 240422]
MPQLTVDARQLPAALLVAGVSALVYFLAKFYAARRQVWKMQRDGLPMPPFSLLAGHFPVLGKIMRSLPPDSIVHNIMWRISEGFPGGIYYINLWPFAGMVMVISDADAASQLEGPILAKGADIVEPLERITGGRSLLTMKGGEWKRWRRLFNPGFSPSYMMGLAPAIADEVAVFRKNLLERCSKGRSDVFQLEELTLKLTFDIIGSVVLDAQLRNQLKVHHLAEALRKQWFNGRRLDRYVAEEIDHRLAERFEGKPSPNGETRSKSVASLFIDEYLKEFGDEGLKSKEMIKKIITPQVRLFLFAGHDTTSGTLQYCYYVLSQYPQVHSRVVAEVDDVFGPDASLVQDKIHDDPQVLNRIPYTTAFIKEVLRIFPPAAAMRQGQSDVNITLSLAIHRNPRHWKDPDVCVPERWLVGPEDPLYPPKGAWRPFEWGPRSCIGQTLAMVELRVALVMTAREFNIKPAYDEWDRIHPRRGNKTVNGDRAYQTVKGGGGAHPADGFPVTVELREP